MAWTWQELEADWLAGGRIVGEPGEVVAAFDRVEASFRREWIDQSRILHLLVPAGSPPATTIDRGSYPVLRVAAMGQLLASLEGIPGAERLIDKLRQGDRGARAEATAIHLLRAHPTDSIVELEPVVFVAGRADRRGDFRVRQGNHDPWTYVEVSATDQTATERETLQLLARFTQTIRSMRGSFSVELYFHNPPDHAEVAAIIRRVTGLNGEPDSLTEELAGGLGVLLWDKERNPTDVSPRIGNVPYRPGLGRAEVVHLTARCAASPCGCRTPTPVAAGSSARNPSSCPRTSPAC